MFKMYFFMGSDCKCERGAVNIPLYFLEHFTVQFNCVTRSRCITKRAHLCLLKTKNSICVGSKNANLLSGRILSPYSGKASAQIYLTHGKNMNVVCSETL